MSEQSIPSSSISYAPDCLTKRARDEARRPKLLRALRIYGLAPAVFVGMFLATGRVGLSGVVAVLALAVSHSISERGAPYLAGLERSFLDYWVRLILGNVGAGVCTIVGVGVGHTLLTAIREAIGIPGLLGALPAGAAASPASALAWSLPVLLLSDFFIYAYHRSVHHSGNGFRWRMHSIHHSIPQFSLEFGARAHPLETLTTYSLCGLAGGMLGVSLESSFCAGVVLLCIMSAHHINCDLELGPLSRVFVSTEAHRWHHNLDHHDSGNYSLVFAFWDRILGTHHEPERFSGRMGVAAFGDRTPTTTLERLLLPLPSHWKRTVECDEG